MPSTERRPRIESRRSSTRPQTQRLRVTQSGPLAVAFASQSCACDDSNYFSSDTISSLSGCIRPFHEKYVAQIIDTTTSRTKYCTMYTRVSDCRWVHAEISCFRHPDWTYGISGQEPNYVDKCACNGATADCWFYIQAPLSAPPAYAFVGRIFLVRALA